MILFSRTVTFIRVFIHLKDIYWELSIRQKFVKILEIRSKQNKAPPSFAPPRRGDGGNSNGIGFSSLLPGSLVSNFSVITIACFTFS
jgi:hypothetical protein